MSSNYKGWDNSIMVLDVQFNVSAHAQLLYYKNIKAPVSLIQSSILNSELKEFLWSIRFNTWVHNYRVVSKIIVRNPIHVIHWINIIMIKFSNYIKLFKHKIKIKLNKKSILSKTGFTKIKDLKRPKQYCRKNCHKFF